MEPLQHWPGKTKDRGSISQKVEDFLDLKFHKLIIIIINNNIVLEELYGSDITYSILSLHRWIPLNSTVREYNNINFYKMQWGMYPQQYSNLIYIYIYIKKINEDLCKILYKYLISLN